MLSTMLRICLSIALYHAPSDTRQEPTACLACVSFSPLCCDILGV